MKIVKPGFEVMTKITGDELKTIEYIGRTCYKSRDKITDDSTKTFIKRLIRNGHESVLEHSLLTVRFICDRATSHELTRHRLASYSQESTRYCAYDDEICVIAPMNEHEKGYYEFVTSMEQAEHCYQTLKENGHPNDVARAVLPNALKTEIVTSTNYREWRHILKLRTQDKAHYQIRNLMRRLLEELQERIPIVFDDIMY